jgi:hypothetical protein
MQALLLSTSIAKIYCRNENGTSKGTQLTAFRRDEEISLALSDDHSE